MVHSNECVTVVTIKKTWNLKMVSVFFLVFFSKVFLPNALFFIIALPESANISLGSHYRMVLCMKVCFLTAIYSIFDNEMLTVVL